MNRQNTAFMKSGKWADKELRAFRDHVLPDQTLHLWILPPRTNLLTSTLSIIWTTLPSLTFFSITRCYRSEVSYSSTVSVSVSTDLTDVTLVSGDTYSRLDCYSSNWEYCEDDRRWRRWWREIYAGLYIYRVILHMSIHSELICFGIQGTCLW